MSAVLVVVSTAAVIAITLADIGPPARAPVSIWFLVVCPGLAVIRLARLAGFVPQLVLSIALSIALAGIIAAAQLYAGAWSPRATLTTLATIAAIAISFDPWLVVPPWDSARLRSIERLIVPLLLAVGAAVVAGTVLGERLLVGGWSVRVVASAAAATLGTAAFAAFVGGRSISALYAAAILLPASVPGLVGEGDTGGAGTTITTLGHAMAWTFVAWIRSARGGGVGWQLLVALGFLLASGVAAVVPEVTVRYVPGALIGLAVVLLVRRTASPIADAESRDDPSLGEPTAGPMPVLAGPAPERPEVRAGLEAAAPVPGVSRDPVGTQPTPGAGDGRTAVPQPGDVTPPAQESPRSRRKRGRTVPAEPLDRPDAQLEHAEPQTLEAPPPESAPSEVGTTGKKGKRGSSGRRRPRGRGRRCGH